MATNDIPRRPASIRRIDWQKLSPAQRERIAAKAGGAGRYRPLPRRLLHQATLTATAKAGHA